jgi:diguanylate cyclase (GGDEF)-like protein/PAS domain S-box-containing protein
MILGNSKPLGVAATVFLAVAIAGSVAGWRSAVEQRTQTSAELANDVLRASDQIDLLISRLRLATQSLAQGIDPQAGTIGGIDQAIATVDGFRTALAISPAGIVLDDSRTGKPAVGVDVSDRAYVEAHQTPGSDFFVGAPVSSRIDGAWTLPTSNAVRTENGELQAIAVISVSSEYFGSVRQIIGEAGAIPFVRRHGHEGFFPLGDEASPDVLDELFAQSPPFHLRTNAGASVSETPFGHIFFFSSATGNFDLAVVLPQTEINGAFNRRFAGLLFASLVCAVLLGAVSGAFAHSWQARRQQLAHTKRLEERLRLATSAAGVGIWDMDLGTGVLVWDKTMHDLYGVAEKDFNGAYEDWRSRVHPDDIAEAESEFNRCLDSGDSFESRFRIIANESTRYISANASVIKDNAGRPVRMIGANFDVTDQVKREAELEEARQAAEQTHAQMERDALHDALTGIANRRGLERELDAAHDAPRYNLVACIDVDHFKAVNDSLGHEAGDAVLTRVAEILTREVGENGFVARLGGDEFLVMAEGARADQEASLLCNEHSAAHSRTLSLERRDSRGRSKHRLCPRQPQLLAQAADIKCRHGALQSKGRGPESGRAVCGGVGHSRTNQA